MFKLKRYISLILAVIMIMMLLPGTAEAAGEIRSVVRIKLSIGSVKSQTITLNGNYYLKEDSSKTLYRQAYTVTTDGSTLTLSDASGNTVVKDRASISIMEGAESGGVNLITVGSLKYRGNMVFTVSSGNLLLVNHVYLDDYIIGVLYGEVGDYYPQPVQEAQAIIARTYAMTHLKSTSSAYDMLDTPTHQVYKGYNAKWTACIAGAEATAKKVLYCDNELVDVYMTNTNGGYVEIYQHAWNARPLEPYDTVKEDPYDYKCSTSPKETVTIYKDAASKGLPENLDKYLKDLIKEKDGTEAADIKIVSIDSIAPVTDTKHASVPTAKCSAHSASSFPSIAKCPFVSGYDFTVTANITADGKTSGKKYTLSLLTAYINTGAKYAIFTKKNMRLFRLTENTADYTLTLVRNGHGVGFSQHGAYQMAKEGKSSSFILDFYYPNCQVKAVNISRPATGGSVSTTPPEDMTVKKVGTIDGSVNVRSGPSTSYSKLGVLSNGSVAEIIDDKTYGSTFYKINYNGTAAYIHTDYVKIDADGMKVTAMGTVTGQDVKVRRGPGTSYDQLALASKNSSISIIKLNAASGWHRVLYNGIYGYMSSQYISVTGSAAAVTGVTLDQKELKLVKGETKTLKATVAPADAADTTVTWSTSDSKVATVSAGKVMAVAKGTCTVTATTKDGGFKASCSVTVSDSTVAVTGVTLDQKEMSIAIGGTKTLTATVAPAGASDKTVTWSTSNAKIATVSAGKVTAVAEGQAVITATTKDGGFKASCTVTVTKASVKVTGVKLSASDLVIAKGDKAALTATVSPAGASNKKVTWASSNASVAKVDTAGNVTGVAQGTAVITVTTADGSFTAKCTVTVSSGTVALGITTGSVNVRSGASTSTAKKAELSKGNLVELLSKTKTNGFYKINYNGTAAYVHSDYVKVETGGMTATENGKVNGSGVNIRRGPGTGYDSLGKANKGDVIYIIKYEEKTGWSRILYAGKYGYMYSIYITRTGSTGSYSISFSSDSLEVKKGSSVTLSLAKQLPSGVTVSFSVSDTSVITYKDSKVTGLKAGTAVITAKSSDGKYTAKCTVKVTDAGGGSTVTDGPVAIGLTNKDAAVYEKNGSTYTNVRTLIKNSLIEIWDTAEANADGMVKIRYKSGFAYMKKADIAIEENGLKVIGEGTVTGSDVRLRRGPGTTFNTLAYSPKGEKVKILEKTRFKGWYRIIFRGMYGYMSSDYIKIS